MEPDCLAPKLSAMFSAPLLLLPTATPRAFASEFARGVEGAHQAPPLPCLLDKAAFLDFHTACTSGANHPSYLEKVSALMLCGVCTLESLCSGKRVKVGVLRPCSPLLYSLLLPTSCSTWLSPAGALRDLCHTAGWSLARAPSSPRPGPSSSPSTKLQPILGGQQRGPSNSRGLVDLKTQEALNRGLSTADRARTHLFPKAEGRGVRERSLLVAPGEELVGSEGTFQSLRCIDKLRLPQPCRRPGDRRGVLLLGVWGASPKQAGHKVEAGAGLPQTRQKRIPRSYGRSES